LSYVEKEPTDTLKTGGHLKPTRPSVVDFVRKTMGKPEDFASDELFLKQIQAHGLAPLLYTDIRQRGMESQFPKQVIANLRASYIQSTAAHVLFSHELESVLEGLGKVGITPVLMKGAHLGESLYEEGGLRIMSDIDILIGPGEFERAQEVLPEIGYRLDGELIWNSLDTDRTGYHYFKGHPPNWVCLEVHNSPLHGHRTGNYSKFDVAGIFERSTPVTVGGASALGMGPEDLLLFLCNHYRFHEFERLIWLYDIGLVWQRFGATMEIQALADYARQLNLSTTLYYCLLFVRDTLEVPVDPALLEKLRPPFVPRRLFGSLLESTGYRVLGASQYSPLRVTLLQHFMVQRNFDLVRLAARLLFPTTANLGARYVGNKVWRLKLIKLFYLIHPFHVLAVGLKTTVVLTRRKT